MQAPCCRACSAAGRPVAERTPIDFAGLAAALLQRSDSLVAEWLPHGQRRGNRWYVGDFDGAEGESANVNLDTGQWFDNAGNDEDRGGDLISLYARIHNLNNGQAARELMERMGWMPVQASAITERAGRAPVPDPVDDERPEPPPEQGHAAAPAAERSKERWRPVAPVPSFAKPPTQFRFGYKDRKQGNQWIELEAARVWRYEFEGELYGYVARFERIDSHGELVKDTVPLTFCEDTSDDRGSHRWHWKVWKEPRPLYVPAGVLGDPSNKPVVVVEGEKCAEALHQLLGDEFDVVSWQGGCKTWALAAWGWIMGRSVILWPDADAKRKALTKAEREQGVDPLSKPLLPAGMQPGLRAMVGIGTRLLGTHGCSVAMVALPEPGKMPDGWDVADAIADGWSQERVRAFLRAARTFVPPDEAATAAAGLAQPAGGGKPPRSSAGADQGEEDDPDQAEAWKRYLLTSASGAVRNVRENVVLALDGWPDKGVLGAPETRGLIAFNEFTNNVEKTRDTPWGTQAGPWEEADELLMGEWLVREYYLPSMPRGTLEESVLMVARRHAFHPVREQVEARRGKWDRVKRLDTWLARTCLEEDEWDPNDQLQRYLALAGRWFLMAMCARVLPVVKEGPRIVRGPGTKFDYMLIFEGPQGWGKSTLSAVLGGEHFADTGLILGDKDSYQNIQGVRVYEWGELENMSKQEVSKVKLFISSPKDRFRASFDRRPKDYPRQVVFVGTTNESHYLTDVTGNRRFWPVRVTRPPDSEWLRENLDQLISEALDALDAGERFWPTREEQRDLFDPQQQSRTVESSLEAAIRHYLYDEDQRVPHNGRNGALVSEIGMQDLLNAIGYTIDKQTDVVVKRAGALMHALGWSVRRLSHAGRPRVYVRPSTAAAPSAPRGSDGSQSPTQGTPPEGDDDCPF